VQTSHFNLKIAKPLPSQTFVTKRRTVRRICYFRPQASCPTHC